LEWEREFMKIFIAVILLLVSLLVSGCADTAKIEIRKIRRSTTDDVAQEWIGEPKTGMRMRGSDFKTLGSLEVGVEYEICVFDINGRLGPKNGSQVVHVNIAFSDQSKRGLVIIAKLVEDRIIVKFPAAGTYKIVHMEGPEIRTNPSVTVQVAEYAPVRSILLDTFYVKVIEKKEPK